MDKKETSRKSIGKRGRCFARLHSKWRVSTSVVMEGGRDDALENQGTIPDHVVPAVAIHMNLHYDSMLL